MNLKEQKMELLEQYMNDELAHEDFESKMIELNAAITLHELESGGEGGFTPEEMFKKANKKFKEHSTKKNKIRIYLFYCIRLFILLQKTRFFLLYK